MYMPDKVVQQIVTQGSLLGKDGQELKKGIWENIMADLVKKSRIQAGRKPDPTYALIDSQSVKTTNKAEAKGIDGGKKGKRSKATHLN